MCPDHGARPVRAAVPGPRHAAAGDAAAATQRHPCHQRPAAPQGLSLLLLLSVMAVLFTQPMLYFMYTERSAYGQGSGTLLNRQRSYFEFGMRAYTYAGQEGKKGHRDERAGKRHTTIQRITAELLEEVFSRCLCQGHRWRRRSLHPSLTTWYHEALRPLIYAFIAIAIMMCTYLRLVTQACVHQCCITFCSEAARRAATGH